MIDVLFVSLMLIGQVSWSDLERLLQEKADASVVKELADNFVSTAAALDRVELSLEGTVEMEEVIPINWNDLCDTSVNINIVFGTTSVATSIEEGRCWRENGS